MNLQISKLEIKKSKEEVVKTLIDSVRKYKDSNSYIESTLNEKRILKKLDNLKNIKTNNLWGSIYSLKDLISNVDSFVSGGSKFLENYLPPFNATVYEALENYGAINLLNSNLDEFGLGGTGLHGNTGYVLNPINSEYIAGGSSSGGAYLVNKNLVNFSIASDTGDSARYPAACCGVIGFKPSYGKISRYGFYPFCSGFDTPSVMASSIEEIAKVFSSISFSDPNDLCTLSTKKHNYLDSLSKPLDKNLKIAVLKDTFWSFDNERSEVNEKIEEEFNKTIEKIRKETCMSVEIYEFPNDLLSLVHLIYMVVSFSESVSNYSNLTGMLFPFKAEEKGKINFLKKNNGRNFSEILAANRKDFGDEFVFRQIMGMYFLDGENYEKIYLQAKKVLSLLNKQVDKLFESYDLIISPTVDDLPIKPEEYKRKYSPSNIKNLLILANFCSLPAISVPWIDLKDMPIGLHFMSAFGKDELLLNVVNHIGKLIREK